MCIELILLPNRSEIILLPFVRRLGLTSDEWKEGAWFHSSDVAKGVPSEQVQTPDEVRVRPATGVVVGRMKWDVFFYSSDVAKGIPLEQTQSPDEERLKNTVRFCYLHCHTCKTHIMKIEAGTIYHIYNRGNNQIPIFYEGENYLWFLRKMRTHLSPFSKIMAWCLMPNHFHWMLYTNDNSSHSPARHPLNLQIGTLLSSYTKGVNNRYSRTGSLFQQRTKAVAVKTENYALTCFHYIHQNPLKARLAPTLNDWTFSSYPDYCGDRNGTLIAKRFTLNMLNLKQEGIAEASKKAIDPNKIKKLFEK